MDDLDDRNAPDETDVHPAWRGRAVVAVRFDDGIGAGTWVDEAGAAVGRSLLDAGVLVRGAHSLGASWADRRRPGWFRVTGSLLIALLGLLVALVLLAGDPVLASLVLVGTVAFVVVEARLQRRRRMLPPERSGIEERAREELAEGEALGVLVVPEDEVDAVRDAARAAHGDRVLAT